MGAWRRASALRLRSCVSLPPLLPPPLSAGAAAAPSAEARRGEQGSHGGMTRKRGDSRALCTRAASTPQGMVLRRPLVPAAGAPPCRDVPLLPPSAPCPHCCCCCCLCGDRDPPLPWASPCAPPEVLAAAEDCRCASCASIAAMRPLHSLRVAGGAWGLRGCHQITTAESLTATAAGASAVLRMAWAWAWAEEERGRTPGCPSSPPSSAAARRGAPRAPAAAACPCSGGSSPASGRC